MIYTLFPLGQAIYTDMPQDFETYAALGNMLSIWDMNSTPLSVPTER